MCVGILFFGVKHSFTHSHIFLYFGGKCRCRMVCFIFQGDKELDNCFWKIRVALIRAGWCDLMQADLLIWSDSAGWTGREVLTVLDEWKLALVTVLVEVERAKMVVVCQSAGTVVHLESHQRGLTIQKCCVDYTLVVLMQWKEQ